MSPYEAWMRQRSDHRCTVRRYCPLGDHSYEGRVVHCVSLESEAIHSAPVAASPATRGSSHSIASVAASRGPSC